MTDPNLREGALALVHGPLVRVVFLQAVKDVPGASVRDTDGHQLWLPTTWLLPVTTGDPS